MKVAHVLPGVLVIGFVVAGCASPGRIASALSGSASSAGSGMPSASVSSSTEPTPTPLLPATTPPPVVASLAPVPTDCAGSPPPDTLKAADFGGGFQGALVFRGQAPVWTLGLPADGVLHLPPTSGAARFPSLKVMWVVGPDETVPATVVGQERSTGSSLWFELYPSNTTPDVPSTYATTLVLDPAAPNRGYAQNGTGNWSIWGIGVGALAAGCYQMRVSSSTGSWTTRLAVGT